MLKSGVEEACMQYFVRMMERQKKNQMGFSAKGADVAVRTYPDVELPVLAERSRRPSAR